MKCWNCPLLLEIGCKALGKGHSQALWVHEKLQCAEAQLSGARWWAERWGQDCSWSLGWSIRHCLWLWGHLSSGGRAPLQCVPFRIAAELVTGCPGRLDSVWPWAILQFFHLCGMKLPAFCHKHYLDLKFAKEKQMTNPVVLCGLLWFPGFPELCLICFSVLMFHLPQLLISSLWSDFMPCIDYSREEFDPFLEKMHVLS